MAETSIVLVQKISVPLTEVPVSAKQCALPKAVIRFGAFLEKTTLLKL